MRKKYFAKPEASTPVDEQQEASVETAEEQPAESAGPAQATPPVFKQALYKTVYAVSFGAVYGSLLLRKLLVPKGGVVDAALHDGAVAAHEALEGHAQAAAETAETVEETVELLPVGEPEAAPA